MTAGLDLALEKKQILEYVQGVRKEYETNLKSLVDLPGVSMDPAHKADIFATADMAASLLKSKGAQAEVVTTTGYPVVIGEFHAGVHCPTVSIYNHLDVQPADASEWRTTPFSMTIEGDRYFGRGTTDDKGPALAAFYAAAYAHKIGLPINIKFIWELEEENGSPSFEGFLKANLSKLKTDSVVVSDTIWVSREKPAIAYGLRGLQGALLRLKTGTKEVHSGLTGGLARNPIGELACLIAELYDATTGQVKFPGFYDEVKPVTDEEVDNFVASGFSVESFKCAHELTHTRTQDAREGAARIWARPTFEVHGITGGYGGHGVKTIVPYQAEAKVSMRLVPNQDPLKVFEALKAFVARVAPDVEVLPAGSLKPYMGDFLGTHAEAAKAAMKEAFGREPAFTREGGSIGAVVSMQEQLQVPILFLGLSLPEHGYHAINENFDWQQASGGMVMFLEYFKRLLDVKLS
jgi:acetylornithine deacetylase/succinyl-diaminopimelate desuccinylase-like protein